MAFVLGPKALFHPLDLGRSVLTEWWAAEDLANAAVSSWAGRINGTTVSQATGSLQPTKAAASFNSAYPGVTFDGVDDQLTGTVLTALPAAAVSGSVIFVGIVTATGTTRSLMGYGNNTAGTRWLRTSSSGPDRPNVSDASASANGDAGMTTLSPFVFIGDWSGTAMNGYFNGTKLAASPTTITSLNTTATRMRFNAGSASSAANICGMTMADGLVLTGVLTTALRQQFEAFFAWKYGFQTSLPATHPYRRFRP